MGKQKCDRSCDHKYKIVRCWGEGRLLEVQHQKEAMSREVAGKEQQFRSQRVED